MATDIKNIKRLKLLRRIGLTGLAVSVFVIIIILILSFLPKGNSAFTIKVDNVSDTSHFQMELEDEGAEPGQTPTSKSFNYLNAKPLNKARTTEASVVEQELENLRKENKLMRSNNIIEKDGHGEPTGNELALVYSLNLKNTSETEQEQINYQVNIDRMGEDVSIIEYLRILIYTYEVGSDDKANFQYFANPRKEDVAARYPYDDSVEDKTLEAISSRSFMPIEDLEETDNRQAYYVATEMPVSKEKYCQTFEQYQSGYLLREKSVTVKPGKTLNFTFVLFFEGKDLDCEGPKPNSADLLLSLHFGS